MKNLENKIKEQLLKELEKSNKRIAELEKSETEPNQAEEELRLHAAMMDNVAEGIYLIGLDDLIIMWTNEKFTRMFGYDPGEMVGKQVDIVNAPTERTPTETRISIVDVLKETGEWHGEVRNIKRDGTHFWCYANVSLFDHPEYGKVIVSVHTDITERKQAEEKEKEHQKNIELLSETAMRFVEFPQDKDIYTFIGEQLGELIGKDSYFVINTIDEKSILTTRAVLGIGKFTDKIVKLMGRHPVGTTLDAKDKNLSELSDGKLHLNEEGLSGIFLKTVPKTVCNSLEKLLNIKKTYGIGFTKDGELFGTIVIILKEGAGELKNKQTIETFIKQASIAIQKRQVEEVLKESKENFQQVISNITTVVWKADIGKNGAFENTYSSPVLDEILDLPAGTMKNDWDKYFSYIKPEYLERVNNAFREAIISPGKKIDCEYEVIKDNGQTAWFQSIGRCFEKNGKLHVFGSTIDITESKRAEEVLRIERDNLKNIFSAIEDGIYIVNQQYDIQYVNHVLVKDFGVYEGRKCYEYFHDRTEICPWCKNPDVFAGKTVRWEWFSSKNGKTYDLIDTPLKNPDGSISKLEIFRDITGRKKAEEEIRKLSKVVETTPEAVVITDMQGTIEYVNQGLLTLGGFEENSLLIGKPVFMFSNEEGVKQLQEKIIPTILSEGKWRGEVPVKRKDGSIFPTDMVCSLILDEEGKPKYLLSQYHDITIRKKAEEKLQVKMNELEAFYRATLGREGRVIELKQEVNELLRQLGKKKKYANNLNPK